jgi:hypothetical protein
MANRTNILVAILTVHFDHFESTIKIFLRQIKSQDLTSVKTKCSSSTPKVWTILIFHNGGFLSIYINKQRQEVEIASPP